MKTKANWEMQYVDPAPGIGIQSRVNGDRGVIRTIEADRVTIDWGCGDDKETSSMSIADLYDLTNPVAGPVLVSDSGELYYRSAWKA